ncbi:MAG TPA: DUF4349 domain-containing protein [Candidatus Dormibacteraeota bacterium]|nr:DUF4349 domain-containing protein [Candidatus Dormibacteraeota bacterium]
MKKVLVIVVILAAAAACGGATSGAGSGTANYSTRSGGPAPVNQGGLPSKTSVQPGDTTTVPNQTVPALQGPPVIRTAQLAITVGSGLFDSKLASVRSLVEGEGGYIAGTDAQASPTDNPENTQIRTGVISFMVPAAHFDDTIDQLSKVGKVQSEHITGTDVSAQYVDLNARLVNAQAQLDAMRALLAKAQNINDIIAVQNQIGQITAQIEQLKGQIKYLDDNTSYSTVSVTLTESGAPAQTAPGDSWGFVTALNQGAHNFMTTINYVVTGLGAIGPFLVLVGLGFIVWRRRRPALPKHA